MASIGDSSKTTKRILLHGDDHSKRIMAHAKGRGGAAKKGVTQGTNRTIPAVSRGITKEKKKNVSSTKNKELSVDLVDPTRLEEFISSHHLQNLQPVSNNSGNSKDMRQVDHKSESGGKLVFNKASLGSNTNNEKCLGGDFIPHPPRPPNIETTVISKEQVQDKNNFVIENEEFEDADDRGISGAEESDMEIVEETPGSRKLGSTSAFNQ